MRILFAGSKRHLTSENLISEFDRAGRQLGQEAARRGHEILIESERSRTLDWYVAEGARTMSEQLSTRTKIELHRMVKQPQAFAQWGGRNIDITEITYRAEHDDRFQRLGARVGGVAGCDAVVLMGGSNGTRLIGELALDLHKPVIPIASFDGAAQTLLEQHLGLLFAGADPRLYLRHLRAPWTDHSAVVAMDAAEALSAAHTYFLSYSHDDVAPADHIELLLRRRRRVFCRDEIELAPGDALKTQLKSVIARSDTFLILWSAAAAASEWCQWEMSIATDLLDSGQRPRRLVMAALDDTSPPGRWAEHVRPQARSRPEREAAIRKITDYETLAG